MADEETRKFDPEDDSKGAIDAALARCILGEEGAATLFYRRLAKRCVKKVIRSIAMEFELPDQDIALLVQDKTEDMALLARRGKLSVEKSYTLYLLESCRNALRDQADRKKGHEKLFSDLEEEWKGRRKGHPSTALFVNSLVCPGKRPERIAIERELIRRVGIQVGGLTDRLRDVIAWSREGLEYKEVATRAGLAYRTIKAEFWQGVGKLREAIAHSGILRPPPPVKEFVYTGTQIPSARKVRELMGRFEVQVEVPLRMIHFEGKSLEDVQKRLGEGRAAVEALLLFGHWNIHLATGHRFPEELLPRLQAHPAYPSHRIPFTYW